MQLSMADRELTIPLFAARLEASGVPVGAGAKSKGAVEIEAEVHADQEQLQVPHRSPLLVALASYKAIQKSPRKIAQWHCASDPQGNGRRSGGPHRIASWPRP
jgi:hypothetical protein